MGEIIAIFLERMIFLFLMAKPTMHSRDCLNHTGSSRGNILLRKPQELAHSITLFTLRNRIHRALCYHGILLTLALDCYQRRL